jgi:DNA helicase HerA-like ATPase
MSKAFAIIGKQGSGKSTSVFNLLDKLEGLPMYIFDMNQEYTRYQNKFKGGDDFDKFLESVKEVEKSVIVFEEATVFITKAKKIETVRRLLVGKRHKKNMIIFIFHNIRSISNEILSLIDFVVLHKTKDNREYVNRLFEHTPENYNAFLSVNSNPNPYYNEQINHSND